MKHYYISEEDNTDASHYAVSLSGDDKSILIQVGDSGGEQIRLKLTRSQANHFAELIQEIITKVKK